MTILLTGSNGFLGKHLSSKFNDLGINYYPVSSKTYDLRSQAGIDAVFKHSQPDIVYHLAAHVGGIQYNIDNPATLYYDNVIMNTQLIHKAALSGVKKFVFVSSVCIYSDKCPVPMKERHIWLDYPEKSNGTYGISKRIALPQLDAYHQQYGMKFEYPILANMYGPGDNFEDGKSHVIPALIKKFVNAKYHQSNEVIVWGTGKATRDFLYVEDAANALSLFLDTDVMEPLNIANGFNIRIERLAEMIADIVGYTGRITFDKTRPSGQMNRAYGTRSAKDELSWLADIDIREGLTRTIEWFKENKCKQL